MDYQWHKPSLHNYVDDEEIYPSTTMTDYQGVKVIPQDPASQGIYRFVRQGYEYPPLKAVMYVLHCHVKHLIPMPDWLALPYEE
jgi:hypothetical protein